MTMKIDGNRASADTDPLRRLDEASKRTERADAATSSTRTDRVEVSDDARRVREVVDQALAIASGTPDVRQDAVARARAALEAGELGTDSDALAKAIVDDLLKRP